MWKNISEDIAERLDFFSKASPWTNVYGLARSFMALSLLLTLLFSQSETLLIQANANLEGFTTQWNFFYFFGENLIVAKGLAIFILIAVISGYVPQLTSWLHWWVNVSFLFACPLIEGGDQLNAILSMLLIPIAVTDRRINHWFAVKIADRPLTKLLCWSFFAMIILQISIVYFQAAVSKFSVDEWLNGTAVYYWATHNIFGVNTSIRPFVVDLMANRFFITVLTWGTLVMEIVFFTWIFMKRNSWNWKLLLLLGCLFHAGIIVLHGLFSFFFSMAGALVLYYIPKERMLSFKRLRK